MHLPRSDMFSCCESFTGSTNTPLINACSSCTVRPPRRHCCHRAGHRRVGLHEQLLRLVHIFGKNAVVMTSDDSLQARTHLLFVEGPRQEVDAELLELR